MTKISGTRFIDVLIAMLDFCAPPIENPAGFVDVTITVTHILLRFVFGKKVKLHDAEHVNFCGLVM